VSPPINAFNSPSQTGIPNNNTGTSESLPTMKISSTLHTVSQHDTLDFTENNAVLESMYTCMMICYKHSIIESSKIT
jgi:hypothetical protein